jgi:hypothetical protein
VGRGAACRVVLQRLAIRSNCPDGLSMPNRPSTKLASAKPAPATMWRAPAAATAISVIAAGQEVGAGG